MVSLLDNLNELEKANNTGAKYYRGQTDNLSPSVVYGRLNDPSLPNLGSLTRLSLSQKGVSALVLTLFSPSNGTKAYPVIEFRHVEVPGVSQLHYAASILLPVEYRGGSQTVHGLRVGPGLDDKLLHFMTKVPDEWNVGVTHMSTSKDALAGVLYPQLTPVSIAGPYSFPIGHSQ